MLDETTISHALLCLTIAFMLWAIPRLGAAPAGTQATWFNVEEELVSRAPADGLLTYEHFRPESANTYF
jgi:hypothetical protein